MSAPDADFYAFRFPYILHRNAIPPLSAAPHAAVPMFGILMILPSFINKIKYFPIFHLFYSVVC